MNLILILLYILLFFAALPLFKLYCGIFLLLIFRIYDELEDLL